MREVRIEIRHRAVQNSWTNKWLQPSNIEHRTVELSYPNATPRIFLLLNFLLFVLLLSSTLSSLARCAFPLLFFRFVKSDKTNDRHAVVFTCSCLMFSLTAALKMNGSHVISFFCVEVSCFRFDS